MLDTNKFKRSVKQWVRDNPRGSMEDLVDFCEELIPPQQLNAFGWLVEQTAGWYEHVLTSRKSTKILHDNESDDDVA